GRPPTRAARSIGIAWDATTASSCATSRSPGVSIWRRTSGGTSIVASESTLHRRMTVDARPSDAADAAVRRAAELLGLDEGRLLGRSQVSVALRCLALDAIERELGP